MKRTLVLTTSALVLWTLGAAAHAQTDIRIGLIEDVDTLDPDQGGTLGGRQVFAALCDKLFDIDAGGNIVGQLVTDWTVSDDGLSIALTLREGVRFHDSTPFDAEAVRANIERSLTLAESRRKGDIRAVDRVEVMDTHVAVLHLNQPFAPLLAQLADRAGMMVSPTAAAAVDAATFGAEPVCSGPYSFAQRVVQDRIVLERFEGHWRGEDVHFDRVIYLPMPDATVRLNNLLAGQLDLIEQLPTADFARVEAAEGFRTASVDGLGHFHLIFNLANGVGAANDFAGSAELRQALSAAIDRTVINDVVFGGNFTPGVQLVAPSSPFFDPSFPVPERDLDRARALVAESGVDSPRLAVTVNNNPTFLRVAQMVQAMASEAGISLDIVPLEANTASAAVNAGDFGGFLSFWSGRADPDGNIFNYIACEGTSNVGRFCNEAADALLIEAAQASDPAARAELYAQANSLWKPEAPILVIYHSRPIFAMRSDLSGFVPIPDGIIRLDGVSR